MRHQTACQKKKNYLLEFLQEPHFPSTAIQQAKPENKGKTIVALFADTGKDIFQLNYLHKKITSAHDNAEVIFMIDNDEMPIGFTMEIAQHSDILTYFAGLNEDTQDRIVSGAREVKSREEMRSYVRAIPKCF